MKWIVKELKWTKCFGKEKSSENPPKTKAKVISANGEQNQVKCERCLVLYIKSQSLQQIRGESKKNCYKSRIAKEYAKKSQQMLMNLVHVLDGRKKRSVAIKAQQKAT